MSLHRQFHFSCLLNSFLYLVTCQSRFHPLLYEAVYLLRRTADEAGRVEQGVQIADDRIEIRVLPDALNEIIFQAKLFHLVRCLVRENLMSL